jgi:hypothetical protein
MLSLALMASPFDSAWLKWGWAVVHAQALDQEIAANVSDFQARKPFVARTKYDPQRHCVSLYVESVEPPPVRLGLRLGDVANNFRASLDQLAWALVSTRGRRPMGSKEPERIYFPVQASRDAFNAHFVVSQFLKRADKAILGRYQPYVRGKRNLPLHCLTPLTALNREDKHRTISPIWMVPQSGKLYYGDPRDCTISRVPGTAPGVVLEAGAEIQRIFVRKTGPNPNLHMEAELSVSPTVDRRIAVVEWLTKTTAHICDLLREFAEPPEEIVTLGIVPAGQRKSPSG